MTITDLRTGVSEIVHGKKETGVDREPYPFRAKAALKELKGQKIAIDMNNFIVKHYSTRKKTVLNETKIGDEPDRKTIISYSVDGLMDIINAFLSNGILPICCYDGKMNKLKKKKWEINAKKSETTKKALDKAREDMKEQGLTRDKVINAAFRKAFLDYLDFTVVRDITKQLKVLTKSFGIPTFISGEAPFDYVNPESESLCAHLCISGKCDFAYSTDSDLFAYGVDNFIVELTFDTSYVEGVRVKDYYINYDDTRTLKQIVGITDHDLFLEFCILCGTDYNKNIAGMRFKKIKTLFDKHGKDWKKGLKENQEVPENFDEIKKMFESVNLKCEYKEEFVFADFSVDDVTGICKEFNLSDENGIDLDMVEDLIAKISKSSSLFLIKTE